MGPLFCHYQNSMAPSYTANSVLIALPILMGSVMRIPLGMLTDKYGSRIVMSCLLLGCSIIAASAYFVQNYALLLVVGFFYGMCGTSFAVGIAQTTRWYPARKQGLALAMFGTGNVGPVLVALFAAKDYPVMVWRGLASDFPGLCSSHSLSCHLFTSLP